MKMFYSLLQVQQLNKFSGHLNSNSKQSTNNQPSTLHSLMLISPQVMGATAQIEAKTSLSFSFILCWWNLNYFHARDTRSLQCILGLLPVERTQKTSLGICSGDILTSSSSSHFSFTETELLHISLLKTQTPWLGISFVIYLSYSVSLHLKQVGFFG